MMTGTTEMLWLSWVGQKGRTVRTVVGCPLWVWKDAMRMHLDLGKPWVSAQHCLEPVSPRTRPHPWWPHRCRSSLSEGTAGSRGSSAAAAAGGRQEQPPLTGKGARTYPESSRKRCVTGRALQGSECGEWSIVLTLPSSSGRPRTCAEKTPRQMKMLGMRPRKPRRFLGAISPR